MVGETCAQALEPLPVLVKTLSRDVGDPIDLFSDIRNLASEKNISRKSFFISFQVVIVPDERCSRVNLLLDPSAKMGTPSN